MRSTLLSILLLLTCNFGFSQKAKDGNYTVTAAGTVLNAYTNVTADVTASATSISVASNTLTNSYFLSALGAGDLILIIQMQGVDMDIDLHPITNFGGTYTVSASCWNDINVGDYSTVKAKWPEWGAVTNYKNAGKYEYAEVLSTAAGVITVRCALKNSYTATGHVQVVRVPRIGNLTLNANSTIVPLTWNGSIGGIVALEVNGTTTFGTNSKISASGFGFRGGTTDNTTGGPAGSASQIGKPAYSVASEGAEKGEGIGGSAAAEYATLYSRYGLGAPANGGGGGNYKNSGGGGGSNVGTGTYNGKGVATAGYNAIWNLETAGMATTPSSGGGRGGYTGALSDQDESTVGPNNAAWLGDFRRNEGGLGGHPLTYDVTRAFMGGGGGAGEMDQNQGGSGGKGGGIVFLQSYGTITGTGIIEANGANGQNSNPTNAPNPGAFSNTKLGVDGAGGAGGGGAIIISNGTAIPNTITLNANGGTGGNNALSFGAFASGLEADGPGGGGGGGMIAFTSGTPVQTVAGGANGTVTAVGTTNIVANSPTVPGGFPPNGATVGAAGTSSLPQSYYNLIPNNASVCSGSPASLSVTVQGTLPSPITNANITWYTTYTGNTSVGTGLTLNIPSATATTTYYVGFCPNGTFRVPVTVTVGGPTISGTAVVTNATCSAGGSITGLTTSGGAPTTVITWNGVTTPSMNLTGASAGSYTVTVTDGIGCTATSGPYVIGTSGGPTINSTNMVITNASCLGGGGSITGITATGTSLTYNWNAGAYSTLDITGLNTGNYNLVVTDNNGCTASLGPINVAQNPGPTINTASMVVTGTTCGLNNGSITGITATGTGLTYTWNGVSSPTLDKTGLASGNYTLIVTNGVGCTATYGPIAIGASSAPVINSASIAITHAHCGQSNGAISGLSVSGGQTAYTYSWNAGAYSTLNLASIPAGNYTLTVTDNLGCMVTAGPFTVNDIAAPVINTTNMVITNETCAGNDGSITGITASGTGMLTYNWNLVPSPSLDRTNIPGGIYGLAVSDAFGCTTVAGPFNVGVSPGPSINATNIVVTGTTCGLNNGSITGITASGTGLTYQWNGVSSPTLDQTGLASGNYTLVVTDASSCTSSYGPVAIGASTAPVINSASISSANAHCGLSNGAIAGLSVSGGQTAYTYSWNSGAYNTLDIYNIPAGNYSIQVTDNLGCIANAGPFTINDIAGPTLNTASVQVTNETCALNDGTISGLSFTLLAGVIISIEWNGVVSSTLNQTNLAPGIYNVVITDNFGCTATAGPFTVNAVVPLSLNQGSVLITPTGCVGNTGIITGIQVVGGINPVVSWSNGPTTLSNANLAAGNYTITVTDDQNCSVQATFTVPSTSGLIINTNNAVITNDNCAVGSGSITGITVSGGTVPYSYSWNSTPAQNSINAQNLTTGNYTLTVTDNGGCTATTTLFVGVVPPSTINQSNVVVTNESCTGNNGAISGVQVSGNGPFTYAWSGSPLTTLNITNLNSGLYTLTITDGNGCVTTGSPITVGSQATPNANFTISNTVASPGEVINFTDASSGGPFQSYSWTIAGVGLIGTGSSASYNSMIETTYSITLVVETFDGCIDSITKDFQIIGEIIIPNIVTANGDHTNDEFYITNLKPNSKLIIQNRWGNIVFESDNYKNDWGGMDITGEKLVDGVYFYQLITADGKMWQGNVHLLID